MTVRNIGELIGVWREQRPYFANRDWLARRVEQANSLGERCEALKAFYECVSERVECMPPHRWAIDPYAVDWTRIFSPIEYLLWCEIRNVGAVLYPQYPVGRYFVDFANPLARVAVECDGKAFHTDAVSDQKRQAHLEQRGWTVYRISGAACMSPEVKVKDDEGYEVGITCPGLRFIERIARDHQIAPRFIPRDDEEEF